MDRPGSKYSDNQAEAKAAVEPLPVLWELTLATFRIMGVQRDTLSAAEVRGYPPYGRFIELAGFGLVLIAADACLTGGWWLLSTVPSPDFGLSTAARDFARLTSAISVLAGFFIWFLNGLLFRFALRGRTLANKEAAEAAAAASLAALASNPSPPDIEKTLEQRDAYEDSLFERNLNDTFLLRCLRWNGLDFLEDGEYRLASRVNILLGKNGYGKTLLFRTLAALVQRDRDTLRRLARSGRPRLEVEITRNGNSEEVQVERTQFRDGIGKIPLLAIPDSRFVNRSVESVAGSVTGSEPLSRSGAKHFLTQQPYEDVIQELLTQLVLDYLSDPKKGLDQPIFHLLESVVRELTDDEEFAFDSIERQGRSSYTILTRSAANRDLPLPVQTASQGTLSILAIFGLIYSFLHSLRPEAKADEVLKTPAIVMIDEVDAHLHPSWQQKIMALLTGRFPNVQFIVSAHSPIIVAGCDRGEVSVLRRPKGATGFGIQRMTEDFLGASARDLYRKVFEIEEVDRLYLEYSAKAGLGRDDEKMLERLAKKEQRSEEDDALLLDLERERRLIDRAAEAREERLKSEDAEIEIAQLKSEIVRLKARIAERPAPVEGPANVKS